MNKDKLKALCHKLSKESGLPFNMIQTHYFLERILEQISSSSECENFIFKGGFFTIKCYWYTATEYIRY